jgi:aminoglycoside phosphotransferase (APT) family kinase protein
MSRKSTVPTETAAAILEHHFGRRPRSVRGLRGGLNNHVFEASVGREEVIVRISDDPAKLQNFQKEQWAVRKARAIKVPAPEILEVGNAVFHLPYMISVKVRGEDASNCANRMEIARAMGHFAARINSIHTCGFGNVFDWSRNQLSRNKSWRRFLDDEIDVAGRVELLAKHRMLSPSCVRKLHAHVQEMRSWKGRPSLTHGDIRFKNVVLDKAGKVSAILDWENCTSNLAHYWELSIALHDLCIDEKEAFLQGYGLTPREYSKAAAGIKTLNLLNYAGAIQHALEKKDQMKLAFLRLRLHGAFDLHSL